MLQNAPRGVFCNTIDLHNVLPFVIKIFVLSMFEWPLKTGFSVSLLFVVCRLIASVKVSNF